MTVLTWSMDDTTNKSLESNVTMNLSESLNTTVSPGPTPAEEVSTSHSTSRSLHSPGVRRPLRSSPLAGPALQADGSILKTTNTRPSRISSTPDLAALSTLPRPLPARYRRPRTADRLQPSHSSERPSSLYSPLLLELEQSRTAEIKRPVSLLQQSLSNSASVRVFQPSSTLADLAEDGNTPLSPRATRRRPKTAHGYPSIPPALPVSDQSSATEQTLPPHTLSREIQSNSWLIASPYEITPKFSRLGLAAPSVVLPVSAKEHKRLTSQNSKLRVKTSISRMTRTDNTTPTSTNTRTSISQQSTSGLQSPTSSNSASGSSAPLQPQENNNTPPAISLVIPEPDGDESPHLRHDLTPQSDKQQQSIPATVSNKRPLARFSVLNFRSLKPSNSSTKLRPLSMGDKIRMDHNNSPHHGEVELGFITSRSSSATSESTVDLKTTTSGIAKLSSSHLNVAMSVKRFWKSIHRWQHIRSRQQKT